MADITGAELICHNLGVRVRRMDVCIKTVTLLGELLNRREYDMHALHTETECNEEEDMEAAVVKFSEVVCTHHETVTACLWCHI